MSEALQKLFEHGAQWLRADFHLHTRADKEFRYDGDDDRFVASYVGSRLINRQSQKSTVAASAMAERNTMGHLS